MPFIVLGVKFQACFILGVCNIKLCQTPGCTSKLTNSFVIPHFKVAAYIRIAISCSLHRVDEDKPDQALQISLE